ncbi:tRNA1(Val) (adenine(37)-N6)-methyltransferase [Cyclobacterium xiamenense]|nr:methyltransferase [Cyclobacterium xiamenense]
MANSYFQFKQFLIRQDRCAMKLSTDAILLGALAQHPGPKQILDIGAGTGVIGLMLAQRFPDAEVHGVEIEQAAFTQASENIQQSPWKERMKLFHLPFQAYAKNSNQKYDLIASNPPYFANHLKSKDPGRNWALHDDQLSLTDLVKGVNRVLGKEGSFWLILPGTEMKRFAELALHSDLHRSVRYQIYDRPERPPHREICCFRKSVQPNSHSLGICLKDAAGQYSQAYRKLLHDFLLDR